MAKAESLRAPCSVTGKVSFKTKARARRALKQRNGLAQGRQKQAYHCRFCGNWHLTSQSKRT